MNDNNRAVVVEMLEKRRDNHKMWLEDFAPYVIVDQKHLDRDSVEQAYWNYGYYVAVIDILKLLGSE